MHGPWSQRTGRGASLASQERPRDRANHEHQRCRDENRPRAALGSEEGRSTRHANLRYVPSGDVENLLSRLARNFEFIGGVNERSPQNGFIDHGQFVASSPVGDCSDGVARKAGLAANRLRASFNLDFTVPG